MRLLTDILLLPVLGPVKLVLMLAEAILEQVDQERRPDADAIMAQMMKLQDQYERNLIDEDELIRAEEELLAQLEILREEQDAS
jgi:hypothetical protein